MPFLCPSGVLTAHNDTSMGVSHTLVASQSTSPVVELGPRHESHVLLRPAHPPVHPLTLSWAGELGSVKSGWGSSAQNPCQRHEQAGSIIPQAHGPAANIPRARLRSAPDGESEKNIGTWPARLHDAAYRHLSCPPQRNVRQERPTGERWPTAVGSRVPTPNAT